MSIMVAVLTLVLLAAVIFVVSGPLLATRKPIEPEAPQRAELQAAREAKYREIRDTELDYRTGKLSSEDFQAVNGALRAEAVEILDKLEVLEQESNATETDASETEEPSKQQEDSVGPAGQEESVGQTEPVEGRPV